MQLCLIDGYGFVFRAYHALPALSDPRGKPIGAVYGFTNLLLNLLEQHNPQYTLVVLDGGGKNFRHDLYTEYKAHRPETPHDLLHQLPIIEELVEALGIKYVKLQGVEADDVIASYAEHARTNHIAATIVSSDKDLMQLVGDTITMYDPAKKRWINQQIIAEKFAVEPHAILDVMSLIGDAADNIPGVKGIGPKTASELITQFGTLEGIYQHLEQIPPSKRKEYLILHKDSAFLSRELLRLKSDLPLPHAITELKTPTLIEHASSIRAFCKHYGFNSLLQKLPANALPLNNTLSSQPRIEEVLLYNTNVGILLKEDQLEIAVQDYIYLLPQSSLLIPPLLQNNMICKYGYNLPIDWEIENYHDIAIMAYSINTMYRNATLESLCIDELPNALGVQKIGKRLEQQLIHEKTISIYQLIDKPLVKILRHMHKHGVLINPQRLHDLDKEFMQEQHMVAEKIFIIAGKEFNLASSKQVANVLFNDLQLPHKQKGFSTNSEVLEELQHAGYEIAGLIIKWRQLQKMRTTYCQPLLASINPHTGRIHATFLQNSTVTSRLSCQAPNLQNIPNKLEEGQKIRSAFIARTGYKLLFADYSQIELRILAEIASVKKMQQFFNKGEDIHTLTASEVFNTPIEQVTPTQRNQAKAINFGIIYGISPYGLAVNLSVSTKEAKEFIDRYLERYPEIVEYMNETVKFAEEYGFVETIMGRKCMIENIRSDKFMLRSMAKRTAINARIQGSQSDIIKMAMAKLPHNLQKYLIMQIHDELIFEIPQDIITLLAKEIKEIMYTVTNIHLVIDLEIGENWANKQPLYI